MSKLIAALQTVMDVYDEYAAKNDLTNTLTQDEAKQLILEQMSERFKDDPEELFKKLDLDDDKEVNFAEFGRLVCSILHVIHKS